MRLGWRIPLPGPFYLGGTVWQSQRPRAKRWHGTLPDGWRCPHGHLREDTATECARKEVRRRMAAAR